MKITIATHDAVSGNAPTTTAQTAAAQTADNAPVIITVASILSHFHDRMRGSRDSAPRRVASTVAMRAEGYAELHPRRKMSLASSLGM